MLFEEIIPVYSENHTKPINTNRQSFVTEGGTHGCHWALKGQTYIFNKMTIPWTVILLSSRPCIFLPRRSCKIVLPSTHKFHMRTLSAMFYQQKLGMYSLFHIFIIRIYIYIIFPTF
jgi:hypothetical protein